MSNDTMMIPTMHYADGSERVWPAMTVDDAHAMLGRSIRKPMDGETHMTFTYVMRTEVKPMRNTRANGVGAVAMNAIRSGCSNVEALKLVKKAFPKRKTTLNSMRYYRSRLRRNGEKVRTEHELRA